MAAIYIDYLNALDIDALAMTDAEILAAVEAGLVAQGNGQTVIEPRVHLEPDPAFRGHFNVLRGYVAPLDTAGVKIVGDYVDNYLHGLPSEFGILNLFDPRTGTPRAILDATVITDMRTGAVTAIGAKHLARKKSKILGHVGARGTAYWNVRLLDHFFDFDEIRVHSRRPESRDDFAAKLSADLGKPVKASADWRSCVEGADIVVEASRLPEPQPLLKTEWIKPRRAGRPLWHDERGGAVAHRHHEQDRGRRLGAVQGRQVRRAARPCRDRQAERSRRCMPSSARSPPAVQAGRERDDETILFWHRGLSLSDIALGQGHAGQGAGQRHRSEAAFRVSAARPHRCGHRRRRCRGGCPRKAQGGDRAAV